MPLHVRALPVSARPGTWGQVCGGRDIPRTLISLCCGKRLRGISEDISDGVLEAILLRGGRLAPPWGV